jgi:hypothetical protein
LPSINEFSNAPAGVTIRPVIGMDSADLPLVERLLATIFPEHVAYVPYLPYFAERRPPGTATTLHHVWLVELDGQPVGLRIFSYMHQGNFGHGSFVGLLPEAQHRGIGAWLVRQTLRQLCIDAQQCGSPTPLGYSAEVARVEDGLDASDQRLREQRLAFHYRCGAVLLPVEYYEPPTLPIGNRRTGLTETRPKQMHLMFYPCDPTLVLTPTMLTTLVKSIYDDIYQVEPDLWYVQRALNSLYPRG